MMTRYEKIIVNYSRWFPGLYSNTIEIRPSGRYCILASLNDNTKIEFNSIDNTIRDVTKFYTRIEDCEINEEVWRKEFGRKLQRAMYDKGINQERLAEMIGISRQMLSRYVRGNSTPSGYILSRLSEILDCDIRELTRFGYIDEE